MSFTFEKVKADYNKYIRVVYVEPNYICEFQRKYLEYITSIKNLVDEVKEVWFSRQSNKTTDMICQISAELWAICAQISGDNPTTIVRAVMSWKEMDHKES